MQQANRTALAFSHRPALRSVRQVEILREHLSRVTLVIAVALTCAASAAEVAIDGDFEGLFLAISIVPFMFVPQLISRSWTLRVRERRSEPHGVGAGTRSTYP